MKYKFADIVFDINVQSKYAKWVMRDYVYSGDENAIAIEINTADMQKMFNEDGSFPMDYYESLQIEKQISEYLLENANGIIFHCTSFMVGDKAFAFTAPSGTGKSTHARMWRETYGDKVVMIDDDKPFIRMIDGEFYIYGTPWNGKHHLGNNIKGKLDSIVLLTRGKENKIYNITPEEMLIFFINQTLRPESETNYDNLFGLIDKLFQKVNLYKLECLANSQSAVTVHDLLCK